MWIKFLLSGLIIGFCIFLGYLAAGKFRARFKFYSQFSAFNERYLTELCYSRKPLSEFIEDYTYDGDFAKGLQGVSEDRGQKRPKPNYLTREEWKEYGDYFSMLGKGDTVSQKNYFSSRKAILEEKKAVCEKECKTRNELYIKLGLLAGLAFVILIV